MTTCPICHRPLDERTQQILSMEKEDIATIAAAVDLSERQVRRVFKDYGVERKRTGRPRRQSSESGLDSSSR